MLKFIKKIKTKVSDYTKEVELDDKPIPLKGDKLIKINEQMIKCTCDIKCIISGHGTGFFCRIPFPNFFHLLPVLITNNHVLGENDIKNNSVIT